MSEPCVPWDFPGYCQGHPVPSPSVLRVPKWVEQADSIAVVNFSEKAEQELQQLVQDGRLGPLYNVDDDGFSAALQTLKEILAQDPRSSHKGLKLNQRGSTTAGVHPSRITTSYKLIFGQCQVEFVVTERAVEVLNVTAANFDPETYVDGIPLLSEQEQASH